MVCVVVLSRRFSINPDNVATPIAASLGDLTTISLLAALARGLFSLVDSETRTCDAASCSELIIRFSGFCMQTINQSVENTILLCPQKLTRELCNFVCRT